jgi:hypothetical protein
MATLALGSLTACGPPEDGHSPFLAEDNNDGCADDNAPACNNHDPDLFLDILLGQWTPRRSSSR